MITKSFERFDQAIAKFEAVALTGILLSMVLVAAAQALLRNLSMMDVAWAHGALASIEWADSFLQKGTLWLAFLGASLATHDDKHIAIDVATRLAPARTKYVLHAVVALGAAIVAALLAKAFWAAVLVNGMERPAEFEVFGASGPVHLCEASAQALGDASLSRPAIFCAVRWAASTVGATVETPGAAFQLIVPVMFAFMAARLVARSVMSTRSAMSAAGDVPTPPVAPTGAP